MRFFEHLYISSVAILDWIIWRIDFGPAIHRIFLAPSVGNFRVGLGKIRAIRVFRHASKKVPAYTDYLKKHDFMGPKVGIYRTSLNGIPEMDKSSYIKKYSITDKLYNAHLPRRGVMFDESSGSSGTPTSWVRGYKERRFIKRIMQVAFQEYIEDKSPIVLNTFSMGAWATGLNTTISLIDVGRVKSLGPDIVKVTDTLRELGSDFEYVICGYPPFLKQLADSKEIDWKKYKIYAIFGGEGISENMRTSLLEKYRDVVGSYGASDLEINIAHETKFTIELRKALIKYPELRAELLKENHGVIPMVFQYNPYDYLVESNDKGELVVTICRLQNISPRVRYNIHDLGHQINFYDLKKILKKHNRKDLLKLVKLDFGVLFHYGRSDLSVDYNGAVVGPEEIKQIISGSDMTSLIESFRLINYEDKQSHKHLLFAIELAKDKDMPKALIDSLYKLIIENLQISNLDFKSALSSSQLKPEIKIYNFNSGIFDEKHKKLKNDYVWNIDFKRSKEEGLAK
jgi:phenylacetate-CoA ligase